MSIKRRKIDMADFNPLKPFNALPLLPPAKDVETKAILKKCIEARSAISELKVLAESIPNQAVLINTIPLLEARDSSEIENIVTTTDKLFRFAFDSDERTDHATKEALRYRTALFEGFKSMQDRPLSASTAVEICSVIKGNRMEIREVPGTALANDRSGEVIYTPPAGAALIQEKLSNWEKYLHNETDIDPLIRMSVTHYQFEAIHPFTDGNGRTGRILNLLFLTHEGLLSQPILYLSRYILANKSDYYSLLLQVTKNQEWEAWILYMLSAVAETAQWTAKKVSAIRELMDETISYIRDKLPKIYTRELVETIFVQPYCRISNLVDNNIARRETASIYLKNLCEIGVMKEEKIGRDKIFIHPKFMKLLTGNDHSFEKYI
jgi:Fic family protein